MILFCDTTGDMHSTIALVSRDGRVQRKTRIPRTEKSGDVFFRRVRTYLHGRKPEGIIVVTGPGRFSGIRHGLAIANTLTYAWAIPVIGIKKKEGETESVLCERGVEELRKNSRRAVVPQYGKKLNITRPKA